MRDCTKTEKRFNGFNGDETGFRNASKHGYCKLFSIVFISRSFTGIIYQIQRKTT